MNTQVNKAAMIAASMALVVISIGSAFAYTKNAYPRIESHECFVVRDVENFLWSVTLHVSWNKDEGKPSSLFYEVGDNCHASSPTDCATSTLSVPGKTGRLGSWSVITAVTGDSTIAPVYSMRLTSSTRQSSLDSATVTAFCAQDST